VRIAVIVNTVVPYTEPLFKRLAERDGHDLLVISETAMERDRTWRPVSNPPFEHVLLDSWTLDLSRLAVGSGVRTRFDTYMYVSKHPLAPLHQFSPDVVVAAGGGIWSSPANVAALAARRRRGWAFVPWWGSFRRERPTVPRRLAEPWVRFFMRQADAWLVYGSRQARDLVNMGADPARTVTAPLTALAPERPVQRRGTTTRGITRYLFMGRLIERKGIDVLLEAFDDLGSGELWVVGDGPLRETVKLAAARRDRIRFLGHLEGDAQVEVYRQTDVLVVPSLYEPWGLVVHEGLAYGLPVIATDQVGAADDLIDPGTNGCIVPAGSSRALSDAMRGLAAWTPAQWERAGKRSSETLAMCTTDRSVEGFIRGCRLAVDHRRRR